VGNRELAEEAPRIRRGLAIVKARKTKQSCYHCTPLRHAEPLPSMENPPPEPPLTGGRTTQHHRC